MEQGDKFGRIRPEDTALLVIDIQERFIPHIFEVERVVENTQRLIRGCNEFNIPVIVTEQFPKGLGYTVGIVRKALEKLDIYEKTTFSIFDDKIISEIIKDLGRPNLLVTGVEAHVCLIKTVLDGLALGYSMHWISDAISSRTSSNVEAAYKRAIQCGAFSSSTEMALFQFMKSSEDAAFREISRIVK